MIKVYVNNKDRSKARQIVEAEILKETKTTYIVRLADGHVVSRKKSRDIPGMEKKKESKQVEK